MLGLQFFVCDECETVYANPPTNRCGSCERVRLREITDGLQDDSYFTAPRR